METNDALAAAIARSGKSRLEIAMDTGLAYTTITRMLSGDRIGNLASWMALAECLGVTLDEITGKGWFDGEQ
jgi:transcriptional regulator with XRE-family HTH domain